MLTSSHPTNLSYGAIENGNLLDKYQAAVNRITECESIISKLYEELSSKDEHIATLEERLVQMSIDLATSKAAEDEQRLTNRRLSELRHSESQGSVANSVTNDTSIRHESAPQRPVFQRAHSIACGAYYSSRSETQSETTVSDGEHTAERRSSDTVSAKIQRFGRSLRSSWLDEQSMDGSIKESILEEKVEDTGEATGGQEPKRKNPLQLKRRVSLFTSILDDSFKEELDVSSRSMPIFGQKKNEEIQPELNENEPKNDQLPELRKVRVNTPASAQPGKKSSLVSLDGVIFPVSTQDVITGCNGRLARTKKVEVSKNEEWPEF
ncbi:hypothetical protein ACHAXS_013848 [Conticribra weissflogii]